MTYQQQLEAVRPGGPGLQSLLAPPGPSAIVQMRPAQQAVQMNDEDGEEGGPETDPDPRRLEQVLAPLTAPGGPFQQWLSSRSVEVRSELEPQPEPEVDLEQQIEDAIAPLVAPGSPLQHWVVDSLHEVWLEEERLNALVEPLIAPGSELLEWVSARMREELSRLPQRGSEQTPESTSNLGDDDQRDERPRVEERPEPDLFMEVDGQRYLDPEKVPLPAVMDLTGVLNRRTLKEIGRPLHIDDVGDDNRVYAHGGNAWIQYGETTENKAVAIKRPYWDYNEVPDPQLREEMLDRLAQRENVGDWRSLPETEREAFMARVPLDMCRAYDVHLLDSGLETEALVLRAFELMNVEGSSHVPKLIATSVNTTEVKRRLGNGQRLRRTLDEPLYVYELLGRTLTDRLDNRFLGRMLPTQALQRLRELTSVLVMLESVGLSHQDLKTDNIMFDGYTIYIDRQALSVIDMGDVTARHGIGSNPKGEGGLHKAGAPGVHVANHEEDLKTGRSDVWSAGLLVIKMLLRVSDSDRSGKSEDPEVTKDPRPLLYGQPLSSVLQAMGGQTDQGIVDQTVQDLLALVQTTSEEESRALSVLGDCVLRMLKLDGRDRISAKDLSEALLGLGG